MAGTSTKDIKNRIKSVESTGQITKAMELVATSKLMKSKEMVKKTRPFFKVLDETLKDIKNSTVDFYSVYTEKRKINKTCYIVIAGDRGMAGGYNINLFNRVKEEIDDKNAVIFPIGRKAYEHFIKEPYEIIETSYDIVDDVTISDCYAIGRLLAKEYKKRTFDKLVIIYTEFVSMLSQEPQVMELLPLLDIDDDKKISKSTIYEPDSETVFEGIVPQYLAGVIYAKTAEALASEFAARRTAMESASKNANEMIDDLTLKFNRARQAAITQEISEIVSGAETL